MRAENTTAGEDTPTAALLRECAAKTVDALIAELRRRPIVQPEWLSLQETAIYCGYSEQQFSDFVKRGIAPKSVLFSRNARRFKRSDVDAWCAAGGPSAYSFKGEPGAVRG
jgi:predicted DNA-binding transcriptional regulator AlpA